MAKKSAAKSRVKKVTKIKRPKSKVVGFAALTIATGIIGITLMMYYLKPTIQLGNTRLEAEVVTTDAQQAKGLGGRSDLESDKAMLFVFDKSDKYCIWMKDMKFSIDVLWYNEAKQLVHAKQDVSPQTYPDSFCPVQPAKYVVEMKAGRIKEIGIDNIQKLKFDNVSTKSN